MRWRVLLLVALLPSSAFAACGPDTAPAQALAAGFSCETFRWVSGVSGDTISEIDTAQTYPSPCVSPGTTPCGGIKLYYGTAHLNGHVTVGSDFTVPTSGADQSKIVIQTTETCPGAACGAFSLNTCGSSLGTGNYAVGTAFKHGFYIEFVGEWDSTGHSGVQTGFYGLGYSAFPGGTFLWEIDDPDAYADDQLLVDWAGGTFQALSNTAGFVRHGDATVQNANKFGALSTTSAFTWWYNDAANAGVDFSSLGGFFTPMDVYNANFCWGFESTSPFPLKIDSVKVWQAGPTTPAGGSGRRLRH